jgi:hypothetical protein
VGKRGSAWCALLTTLALTGCGVTEDPEAEPGKTTAEQPAAGACDLLTAEELKAAFGRAADDPKPRESGPFSGCEFSAREAPFYLHVGTWKYETVTGRDLFERTRRNAKNPEPVNGVGSEAFSATTPLNTDVTFLVGDKVATMTLFYWAKRTGDPKDDVARVSELAKKAVARL